jgi:osmoprotectant transport system ATP-binding protein
VIQQIGLFPHQTVAENIATVPRLMGWPKDRIAARVQELLKLIGLDPEQMGPRYPAQLSGGQRQRVGVARALAADPPLMLMDEPFGAIDPINRSHLQDEFLALQKRVKKTVVFVTHDIDEAIKMGDRIAILREGGKLAQYDTPQEILAHPADDFVARFVGADRAIKRLSLTALSELKLLEPNGQPVGEQKLSAESSVRDALAMLLTAEGRALAVLDGEGEVRGLVTLELVERLLSKEGAQ